MCSDFGIDNCTCCETWPEIVGMEDKNKSKSKTKRIRFSEASVRPVGNGNSNGNGKIIRASCSETVANSRD